jgi:hypothetical protein
VIGYVQPYVQAEIVGIKLETGLIGIDFHYYSGLVGGGGEFHVSSAGEKTVVITMTVFDLKT